MDKRERLKRTIQNRLNESRNRQGAAVMIAESTLREMLELVMKGEPLQMEIEGGGITWFFVCPECHGAIDCKDRFCRYCGQAVKE